ncbi:hypothetical protein [Micavibrio aeruginosavorus]|uniref:hypothetical protein n=1 Tax=Micavibrio aeruginosavorus TaxID=349221 RepID=UPI003F4AD196
MQDNIKKGILTWGSSLLALPIGPGAGLIGYSAGVAAGGVFPLGLLVGVSVAVLTSAVCVPLALAMRDKGEDLSVSIPKAALGYARAIENVIPAALIGIITGAMLNLQMGNLFDRERPAPPVDTGMVMLPHPPFHTVPTRPIIPAPESSVLAVRFNAPAQHIIPLTKDAYYCAGRTAGEIVRVHVPDVKYPGGKIFVAECK